MAARNNKQASPDTLSDVQKKVIHMRNRTAVFNEMWKDALFKSGLALAALSLYQTYLAASHDTDSTILFFLNTMVISVGSVLYIKEYRVNVPLPPLLWSLSVISVVWWYIGVGSITKPTDAERPFPSGAMFFVFCYGAKIFMQRSFDQQHEMVKTVVDIKKKE